MRAEQVTVPVTYHGEGPVWSERWDGLRWVDMLAGDVLLLPAGNAGTLRSWQPGSGPLAASAVERRHVGKVAAAVRPRTGGGAVIGVERGFALEDPDGSVTTLDELWTSSGVRMNEGGCDPHGRFYCGSMAYDHSPGAAALHRLDPDGSVTVVLDGVTVSNGLEWSPDGTLAYYNDTATHAVSVFDYDRDSGLTRRRTFVEIGDRGRPDGLTVDAEGGVWVAIVDQGVVHRYRPDGTLDEVVEVAATKVTACAFGGDDLDELFVTTSREGLEPVEDPNAGALFSVRPGVRGLPTREFAG